MAKTGEWTEKGATLTDASAEKEYGISREFIVAGIRAGQLEYQNTSMWGNPALRLLRGQLEKHIDQQFGSSYLEDKKNQTELKKIKSSIIAGKRKLTLLEKQKTALELKMLSDRKRQENDTNA